MNQKVLEAKKVVVSEIAGKFAESQSTVVVEYRGLSVAQMTTLRRKLREENIEMKIYKNKLASRAAESAGFDELTGYLTGPNAFVFSDDAVAPSRLLAEFAKKNKALVLKSGIVEGKIVDDVMLKELATLPNREGMISMLLGLFQAPIRNFAYALDQVAQTRGDDVEAPAEAVKEEAKVEEVKEAVAVEAEAAETEAAPEVEEAPAEEVAEAKEEKSEDQ